MADAPDHSKLLHLTDRREWRDWLEEHWKSEAEVWLVYAKRHTGRPRIAYNDAVEEALCFGWIDSIVRTVDDERFAQRFSVRKPGRPYSQANKERLRALIEQGKVMDEVLATLGDLVHEEFTVPPDILAAVRADPEAWRHFQSLSPPYVRIRVAFIDTARDRPEEFRKRLAHFINMTAKNKRFGFGGIEKYY
jgi:uncharacterized protein YdeI (YjbR/CyaY-like superfamily)